MQLVEDQTHSLHSTSIYMYWELETDKKKKFEMYQCRDDLRQTWKDIMIHLYHHGTNYFLEFENMPLNSRNGVVESTLRFEYIFPSENFHNSGYLGSNFIIFQISFSLHICVKCMKTHIIPP